MRQRCASAIGWLTTAGLALLAACAGDSGARRPTTAGPPIAERSTPRRPSSDPAPEMAIQSDHGYLSEEDAHETIRRNWKRLTGCYAKAETAQDFAEGTVKLKFAVARDGKTSEAHVALSRLGNFEVERCLTEVARSLVFPEPEGGAATVEYSLEFRSTGEVPVIDFAALQIEPHRPALLQKLASECRQLGVEEVTSTLYIAAGGKVRSAGLASDKPMADETARCVATTLQAWSAPVDVAGGAVARIELTLSNRDVLHPPAPAKPTRVSRVTQGQRARRR